MSLFLVVILFILVNLLLIIGYVEQKRGKYPGPGLLETIKGFLTMDGQLHVLLFAWAEKYGTVFSFYLGTRRHFVISDVKLVRELFQLNEWSSRPKIHALDPFSKGATGLINSNGKEGQAHRMFAMTTLKSFGLGKPQMNKLFLEEIAGFMSTLDAKNGEPVCIKGMFMTAITNNLWISIASKRFSETDPILKAFKELLSLMEKLGESPILALCPTVTEYLPWIPVWKRQREMYTKVYGILENMVEEHENTRIFSKPRNFIDAYLDKAQINLDENSCFYQGKNLVPVLIDFIIAGSDTMSMAMEWCTLHMIRNLHVQEKVQEELKRVVGTDKLPTLDERPNCIYTQATILEIMRITPPAILAIPHCTTEQTIVDGKHSVPANSAILANLYLIQNDKKVWGDPESFRPERWLTETEDEDGKPQLQLNRNNEHFLAWGVGKRRCTGENLARDSIYLLFTSLLSRFKITCPPQQPMPSLEAKASILRAPQRFSAIFTPITK